MTGWELVVPIDIEKTAASLLRAYSVDEHHLSLGRTVVTMGAQTLAFPTRIYHWSAHPKSVDTNGFEENRILAHCFGTRHHDGFIREFLVRSLVRIDHPLVVPFIVRLLGEYVIEIIQIIAEALPDVNRYTYGEFACHNRAFMETNKRRAISYWNCYFRHEYRYYRNYPAFIALEQIEGMAKGSSGARG